MSKKNFAYIFLISIFFFFYSCKKIESPPYISINAYYPLQAGSSYTYRLDSTVLAPFGSALVVHSYLLKDSIESNFYDNSGRLSYRVYRFITDTLQSQPWQYLSTYYITPTSTTIEVMDDNNYRFIKLADPVVNGFSWQGNTYIDTKSAESTVQFMDGWNYTYENVNESYTVPMGTLDSTITILQDTSDVPDVPFSQSLDFYEHVSATEVYAKNIGLIYKEFTHWTWQINPEAAYQDGSYGIKLSLINYQ